MEVIGLRLDRVTIVGKMIRFPLERNLDNGKKVGITESRVMQMLRCERDWRGENFDYARESIWMKIKGNKDLSSKSPYDFWYRVGEHIFIQVLLRGGGNKGSDIRIDWNPSKVTEDEYCFVCELLRWVIEKRFTRIDIALDIKKNLSLGWRIDDRKRRKRIYYLTPSGRLETRYCGTNYSEVQVRIYDKAREQNRELSSELRGLEDEELKVEIKEEYRSSDWWRIEETIRGKAVADWENHQWFDGVEIYKEGYGFDFPEGMKAGDKASVIACSMFPELLDEFSKATRAKIKRMMDEVKRISSDEKIVPADLVKTEMFFELKSIKNQLKDFLGESKKKKKKKKYDRLKSVLELDEREDPLVQKEELEQKELIKVQDKEGEDWEQLEIWGNKKPSNGASKVSQ